MLNTAKKKFRYNCDSYEIPIYRLFPKKYGIFHNCINEDVIGFHFFEYSGKF
jgi:hypothetical protein